MSAFATDNDLFHFEPSLLNDVRWCAKRIHNKDGDDQYTFQHFIDIVHRQVMAMIGIDLDNPDGLTDSAVMNPGALRTLETLGSLHLVFASAGAPGRGGESYLNRAVAYQKRYADEKANVVALVDLDGDGIAETRRHPNSFVLARS